METKDITYQIGEGDSFWSPDLKPILTIDRLIVSKKNRQKFWE